MDCALAGWDAEDALGADPDPDGAIQGLLWAEVGLPDCQGWAWGLAEEEGAFVLNEGADEPAKNTRNDIS